jgi:hypothetical protein
MFKFLVRIAMFLFGVLLLLDIGLPTTVQTTVVDRHFSGATVNTTAHNQVVDTNYNLQFSDGRSSSCSVGYSTYNAVKDGDEVSVRTTKVLRRCVDISRNGEFVYEARYWKLGALIGGLIMIAAALGWIENEDNAM